MLFSVRFHDDPSRTHVRTAHMAAHLDWLRTHEDRILIAGSLRPEPEAFPVGALWIVECKDKPEVEALLRTDPFWMHGLRTGVEILSWHRAFPEAVMI